VQLHGTDDKAFHEAVSRAIDTGTHFPLVADLTRLMLRIAEEWKTYAPHYALAAGSGTVGCLTCMDAGFVRRDVPVAHPEFGMAIPCPHCDGAKKPRDHKAEYLAFLRQEKAEIERLAPYREEAAARRQYAPVANAFPEAEPPPEGFLRQPREQAEHMPVPFCMTPFVIVPKANGGRRGFVAQWANSSDRSKRENACEWRESREAIRAAMVNLYADIREVKA
jgi:hypothetical protein